MTLGTNNSSFSSSCDLLSICKDVLTVFSGTFLLQTGVFRLTWRCVWDRARLHHNALLHGVAGIYVRCSWNLWNFLLLNLFLSRRHACLRFCSDISLGNIFNKITFLSCHVLPQSLLFLFIVLYIHEVSYWTDRWIDRQIDR